jgi:hypothetical protein
MLASDGQRWFDRRRPDSLWPSAGVGVVLTVAMFGAAFAAMRTVRGFRSSREAERVSPVALKLETPTPPLRAPAPAARVTRLKAPSSVPVSTPSTLEPSAVSPLTSPGVAAETPRGDSTRAAPGTGLIAPGGRGGGAGPTGPSGVTIGSRQANTQAYRDSVLHARMQEIPALMLTHPPTGRELAELEETQRNARNVARRTTTAGSQEVHVMMGNGRNGVGAVGGGAGTGSISAPLFSSGPSASQRKKNESLYVDYWLRLGRLNDRLALARDSARLDSLRRDSLHRDSLARRRIVP